MYDTYTTYTYDIYDIYDIKYKVEIGTHGT